ncbi:uncharacterized protein LOC113384431 [Ctenocephalides felis]|uniref:uncharacterized protein LOC113384431 n=1 Tax=Ctenocephalides felis TaxID=7515 RepID=UPI000E6E4FEC|nr:uncharacterized protein LOC113384431 [Ctenocephalides felis]
MLSVANDNLGGGDRKQIKKSSPASEVATSSVNSNEVKTSDEGNPSFSREVDKTLIPPSTSSSDDSVTNESSDDTETKDSSLDDILANRERPNKTKIRITKASKEKREHLTGELVKSLADKHSKVLSHNNILKIQYMTNDQSSKLNNSSESSEDYQPFPKNLVQIEANTQEVEVVEVNTVEANTSEVNNKGLTAIKVRKTEIKNTGFQIDIEEKNAEPSAGTEKVQEAKAATLQTHSNGLEEDKVVRSLKSHELPSIQPIPILDVSEVGGEFTDVPDDSALLRMRKILPYFVRGRVVAGFGRGSRELGIPTANFSKEVVDDIHDDLCPGVYYGWAKVDPWPVMKMVMNLGWNPYYENRIKSLEVHILYDFPCDFYGSHMRICILGYIRPEAKFNSMEDLIKSIQRDTELAKSLLDNPDCMMYRFHEYFGCVCEEPSNG